MAAPMRDAFCGAVKRILNSWTVLKLAVSHGFGGPDSQAKAEWMVSAVDQWFAENANIDPYEVEDFLADVLNAEFDTMADDGSLPEIAALICGCYRLCKEGKQEQMNDRLSKLPQPAVENCVQHNVQDNVEEGEMDGNDEPSQQMPPPGSQSQSTQQASSQQPTEMETDEDGWQTVKKKGKR